MLADYSPTETVNRHCLFSKIASGVVIAVASLSLIGWLFHIDILKSLCSDGATMKPNTALSLVLAGSSLWLQTFRGTGFRLRVVAGRTSALVVLTLAAATWAQWIFSRNLGIDELLVESVRLPAHSPHPVRMASATAFALMCGGAALLVFTQRRLAWVAQILGILTALIGLVALEGYLFGMAALYDIEAFSSVALNTAFSLVLLGIGILFASSDRGIMRSLTANAPGGIMARSVLPVVIILPILVGWLRMWGQNAGLYNTEFGLALFATSNIVIVSLVVWLNARFLNRAEFVRDEQNRVAQTELGESRERYRKLINLSPGAILTSRGNRITFVNAACLELLGTKDATQLLGRSPLEIFHSSCHAVVSERIAELIQKEQTSSLIEEKVVKLDGTVVDVEVAAASYRDSEGVLIQIILHDITAKKKAAEALRESEEHLRLAVLGARLGTWHWNTVTGEMIWSDVCKELFGLPHTTVPSYELFMNSLHPEEREHVNATVQQALRDHTKYSMEYRVVLPDGTFRWIAGRGHGFYDETGKPTRMEGVILDISERKQSEEQLATASSQLRALALRLESIREQERTNLAREIHDVLAQELTRLKIDAVWTSKRLTGPTIEEPIRQSLEKKIREMTAQIDSIIGTVQKIATELRPVVLDSLGLSAAVEWQTEDFAKRTGIPCHADVPTGAVLLDRRISTALFRILQESLTNVIRHANATEVSVSLVQTEDTITLKVKDNGPGITPENIRDMRSIGLIGMRERAQTFNGTFDIRGEPGCGTTVSVNIPFPETSNL